MGVACLKIEGRMKRPEYVAAVTEIYARLLREHRTPTKDEQKKLALAFSRDGFTEGYYRGVRGREMFGTRPKTQDGPRTGSARFARAMKRKICGLCRSY